MRCGRRAGGRAALYGGLGGLVGAMAMTGARTASASLGAEEKSPPEAIVERHSPQMLRRLPQRHRSAVTELIHWTYGAGGGVLFGLLPERLRLRPWSGPAYGLLFWLGYEVGIARFLDVESVRERRVLWRLLIAADHALYGLIVAAGSTRHAQGGKPCRAYRVTEGNAGFMKQPPGLAAGSV